MRLITSYSFIDRQRRSSITVGKNLSLGKINSNEFCSDTIIQKQEKKVSNYLLGSNYIDKERLWDNWINTYKKDRNIGLVLETSFQVKETPNQKTSADNNIFVSIFHMR